MLYTPNDLDRIAHDRAITRRSFIRSAVLAAAGGSFLKSSSCCARVLPARHKIVVVTFGGGARDEETFAPEGQQNIPRLIKDLIPQASFFTQVVNRGILGHYVATASLATGAYESFDNFRDVAPHNPTIFEYYRQGLHRPASDAWVIAPSNGFNHIGQSDGSLIAPNYGAEVVLPKQLLATAIEKVAADRENFDFILQDNYENPFVIQPVAGLNAQMRRLQTMLRISFEEFVAHAGTLSSADELSVFVMRQIMKHYAPNLLWITLHDMDVAHSGAFSLYLDGIQRTDRLCGEIWEIIESEAEYKGRTTLVILPDFGRDSDFDGAGNGFQHHRTGDALSRTTWMMVLGPGIRQNATFDRQIASVDVVPTIGAWMGVDTPHAVGRPVSEVL